MGGAEVLADKNKSYHNLTIISAVQSLSSGRDSLPVGLHHIGLFFVGFKLFEFLIEIQSTSFNGFFGSFDDRHIF